MCSAPSGAGNGLLGHLAHGAARRETYSLRYVDRLSGETHPVQLRIRGCSRRFMNNPGEASRSIARVHGFDTG